MKKLILGLLVLMAVASCKTPVQDQVTEPSPIVTPTPVPTIKISVLNSLWKVVKQDQLERSIGKTIQSTEAIQAEIDAYNAQNISDQWFLVEGDIPSLDEAPPAQIYIVDKATHLPIEMPDGMGGTFKLAYQNWPRKQLVERYDGWKQDAINNNADLYVDVIPPPPAPPTEDQLYAKYSFYAVDSTGAIMYQDHGYPLPEGWTSLESFQTMQYQRYQLIIQTPTNSNLPWRMITGEVYTQP